MYYMYIYTNMIFVFLYLKCNIIFMYNTVQHIRYMCIASLGHFTQYLIALTIKKKCAQTIDNQPSELY